VLRIVEIKAAMVDEEEKETLRLLQLRNPWGMREWKGDWADNDTMWDDYPTVKTQLMGTAGFQDDGKFWISWSDFKEQYNQVFLCVDQKDGWHGTRYNGKWDATSEGSFPGGCPKYKSSFAKNPQYPFTVTTPTKFAVCVFQRDIRWRDRKMAYTNGVGFVVMALTGDKKRIHKFSGRKMRGMSRSFVPDRQVYTELPHELKPGRYVLIPVMFKPDGGGTFGVEIYTSQPVKYDLTGEDIPDIMDEEDSDESDDDAFDHEEASHEDPDSEDEGRILQDLQKDVGSLMKEMMTLKSQIGSLESRVQKQLSRLEK